jgi:hypothetical protein
MKKKYLIICLFLVSLFSFAVHAQDDDYSREKDKPEKPKKEKDKKTFEDFGDRIVIGGGLGLQLGTQTYIEVSPKFGYRLTERALAGVGLSYIYYSENLGMQGKLKTSIYGGSIFGSYEPIENLFGWVEYEMLNFEYFNQLNEKTRKWIDSPFIGIGYRQPISDNGFIQLTFLYNLNYRSLSPYSSPWVPRISIFL